jgi:hypothetical protein
LRAASRGPGLKAGVSAILWEGCKPLPKVFGQTGLKAGCGELLSGESDLYFQVEDNGLEVEHMLSVEYRTLKTRRVRKAFLQLARRLFDDDS